MLFPSRWRAPPRDAGKGFISPLRPGLTSWSRSWLPCPCGCSDFDYFQENASFWLLKFNVMDISDLRARFEASVARTKVILERADQLFPAPVAPAVVEPPAPLPALVVPILPEARAAFHAALLATQPHHHPSPDWWTKVAYRKWRGHCVYCGREVPPLDIPNVNRAEMASVDHLISVSVGGPDHLDAIVLACLSCNSTKRQRDWIMWGKAVDKKGIKALRMKLSRQSWNHLAPDPVAVKTKLKVERMLDARWEHPRFLCHASINAGGSYIGWKDGAHVPPAMIWLLRQRGAEAFNDGDHRGKGRNLWVFSFTDQRAALDAIWELVAHNALVRRLDLSPEFPDATPSDNEALADWAQTFPNVSNLVKRRWNKPSGFRGHSQAWREGRVTKGENGAWIVRDPVRKLTTRKT